MHTDYGFLMAYRTFIAMMYLCLLVICIVQLLIYREVKKQQRQVNGLKREEKFGHKALSTTVLILLTFFVCWAPCMVCWVIGETLPMSFEIRFLLRYITSNLTCLNCVCDPLIYSLRLSKVRKIWRRSFKSCFRDGLMHSEVTRPQHVQLVKLLSGKSMTYAHEHVHEHEHTKVLR